jgi:CrcB protein
VKWLLLFLGGGCGAMLRFAPAVDAAGCFAVGLIATLADEGGWLSPTARLLLVPGLLRGFTTFSAFGIETWRLLADGAQAVAFGYLAASVGGGLACVAAGVVLGRAIS